MSRYLLPLLLLLSAMAAMPKAQAQTPMANWYVDTYNAPAYKASSQGGACALAFTAWKSQQPNQGDMPLYSAAVIQRPLTVGTVPYCKISRSDDPTGNYGMADMSQEAGTTCPGNSTGSGGTCACPANLPHWETSGMADGYCYAEPFVCEKGHAEMYDGPMPAGKTFCDGSCILKPVIGTKLKNGHESYTAVFTGDRCPLPPVNTQPVDNTPPNPCTGGTVPVILGGQTLCLAPGKPGTEIEVTQRDESKAQDGKITETTKETTCIGTSCKTDSTTVYTNADGSAGGTGTKSETSVGLPGGGGGGGIGLCDDEMKNSLLCVQLGTPTEVSLNAQAKGPNDLVALDVGNMTGSCPSDIALPHGMSFSFAPVCTMATSLRPIIIGLAWLGAGLIVLGGMRRYA